MKVYFIFTKNAVIKSYHIKKFVILMANGTAAVSVNDISIYTTFLIRYFYDKENTNESKYHFSSFNIID